MEKAKSAIAQARENGVSYQTFKSRLSSGWPMEDAVNKPIYQRPDDLTEKQRQVYDIILSHYKNREPLPTVREIAKILGYSSNAPVQQKIDLLEAKGWIKREPHKCRAIKPLRELDEMG